MNPADPSRNPADPADLAERIDRALAEPYDAAMAARLDAALRGPTPPADLADRITRATAHRLPARGPSALRGGGVLARLGPAVLRIAAVVALAAGLGVAFYLGTAGEQPAVQVAQNPPTPPDATPSGTVAGQPMADQALADLELALSAWSEASAADPIAAGTFDRQIDVLAARVTLVQSDAGWADEDEALGQAATWFELREQSEGPVWF